MRIRIFTILAILLLTSVILLPAVEPDKSQIPETASLGEKGRPIAFVNVNLIPMDREAVITGQTVVVQDSRITAIGPADKLNPPPDSIIIDGTGRYLLPGLTDAHVHLDNKIGARPDFGDAPLFLAYGITTVFNLRGEPEHIGWKKRIREGQLLAPNLYTSGEFVNEPRVTTPEEAEQEVEEQVRAGYDLIKFREVIDFQNWHVLTTKGMERSAYLRLNEAARSAGIPLIGHAPYRVGLKGLLRARQSLAHMNELANLYFLPPLSLKGEKFLELAKFSFLLLAGVLLAWLLGGIFIKKQTQGQEENRTAASRIRNLSFWLTLAAAGGAILWILVVPPGLLFGNILLLVILSGLGLSILMATIFQTALTAKLWRAPGTHAFSKICATLAFLASLGLAFSAIRWIPFAWHGSDLMIGKVARECKEAGISVQSTLVLYETGMNMREGYKLSDLLKDPAFPYLPAQLQEQWRGIKDGMPVWMKKLWRRHPAFNRALAAALHKAGVPVMAGTDALGAPFIVPGTSLHKELRLLEESGFTPYEALRAATIIPAEFLGKDEEFGTIAPGKRADLLLIEGNPLEDLGFLKKPLGVMVRGIWLPEQRLDQMMAALAAHPSSD